MKTVSKKICICGDSAVGKTSLIRQFVTGKFDDKYLSTLGTVISRKSVEIPKKDYRVNLMIWDISGQAEFKYIQASGFSNAAGCFIVCDVTRKNTISNVRNWLANIRRYTNKDIPAVIIVNKTDLLDDDKMKLIELEKEFEGLNCKILTTSAKTGENVERAFRILGKKIVLNGNKNKNIITEKLQRNENFSNPRELLDYVTVCFCKTIGDMDMGMHIVRNQIEDEGVEFFKVSNKEMEKVIKRLVKVTSDLKGKQADRELKAELFRAYIRNKES